MGICHPHESAFGQTQQALYGLNYILSPISIAFPPWMSLLTSVANLGEEAPFRTSVGNQDVGILLEASALPCVTLKKPFASEETGLKALKEFLCAPRTVYED